MKTIKMKKADWEKWDTALRSGEYVQTADHLYFSGAYCCLGVSTSVVVEKFAGDNSEAARAKAVQVTRDSATEVFLSQVVEKFWLAPTVESELVG